MESAPTAELNAAYQLVTAVQELSLARDLARITEITRRAARILTGADGATFVLREGTLCHYADEDAIGPLWKGKRFPMAACISGWVMTSREAAAIEDIYADPRVPADAYRPTFVKSLAMVPIRRAAPIGAIGNYWAQRHQPTATEIQLLQALADSTSIAMENVAAYAHLEQRVRDRTAELEVANRELETFSYTVSHDLRAPVRHVRSFTALALQEPEFNATARTHLARVTAAADRMNEMIEDTLKLARITTTNLRRVRTDLSAIAAEIATTLRVGEPARPVTVAVAPGLLANGDPSLLRIALENLLGNAWKFTAKTSTPQISLGAAQNGTVTEYFVRDNGVGFDLAHASRLFQPFARLHSDASFAGNGIGLATVRRIVEKHGGSIRAESSPNRGATFFFTLP